MTAAVLVVRRGGLGDTLLLLPVLAALRRRHRGAELHFAGVSEFGAVLRHFAAVDRALSSETLQLWSLRQDSAAGEAARARLLRYAQIVADDAAVQAVADATHVQVFDPRPARDDVPLAQQIGEQLGLEVTLADAQLVAARAATDGALALAPGSGSATKCWPRERWLELAARASAERLCVVVGPTEVERDDPRRWGWPAGTQFLADRSCTEVAQRLATARAFVGNDSGVTHLAAALRVPTVAVFGPGEPRVFAPPGPHVRVAGQRTRAAPEATVAAVQAALAAVAP